MNLLGTIADLIVLHLLFVICCIPIVTIGAAYSAKYYVAMKLIRGEESGVFKPFFKAFIRNFKQSTIVWAIFLVAYALLFIDWRWIIYNGWSNTAFIYKLGVIVFTVFVWLMTLTIFPTIARYEMKTSELFKAALIFSIIKIIPLILISALIFGSVIACLWYAQWFPLIYVFTTTTITYFMCLVFIKQFDKLEKVQSEKLEAQKAATEKAIEEADVVLLVLDQQTGPTLQDKRIAGKIQRDAGKVVHDGDINGIDHARFRQTVHAQLLHQTLHDGFFADGLTVAHAHQLAAHAFAADMDGSVPRQKLLPGNAADQLKKIFKGAHLFFGQHQKHAVCRAQAQIGLVAVQQAAFKTRAAVFGAGGDIHSLEFIGCHAFQTKGGGGKKCVRHMVLLQGNAAVAPRGL